MKRKVYAYITHATRLLVFSHPQSPEAGIQIPGGTIERGEDPEAAVMREAFEETGLDRLALGSFLGETIYHVPGAERTHRRFYHLVCGDDPPEAWRRIERHPSEGDETEILFGLFWVDLSIGVPPLTAGLDAFLAMVTA